LPGDSISALARVFLERGVIDEEQLRYAERVRNKLRAPRPVLQVLKDLGHVTDERIHEVLSQAPTDVPVEELLLELDLLGQDEFEEALVHELLASMHAEQGAALLRNWNIPEVYADVVARHHEMDFDDEDTLQIVVRLVDQACNKLGLGLEPDPECNVAASAEAQVLRVSDVLAAELEIKLEDALSLS